MSLRNAAGSPQALWQSPQIAFIYTGVRVYIVFNGEIAELEFSINSKVYLCADGLPHEEAT